MGEGIPYMSYNAEFGHRRKMVWAYIGVRWKKWPMGSPFMSHKVRVSLSTRRVVHSQRMTGRTSRYYFIIFITK